MTNVPYIFPQASNNNSQPWWLGGMKSTQPASGGVRKRRNRSVFYNPQTGPDNSAAVVDSIMQPRSPRTVNDPSGWMTQTPGATSNDVAVIDAIMKPRSPRTVNDPSGWLNGGASREFQSFFNRGLSQEENTARRQRELDANSLARMDPAAGRQVVDVARQNQEAMNMIFPKAPQGQRKLSSDIAEYPMAGGGTQRVLDGRYGTGSATIQPQQAQAKAPPAEWNSWSIPSANDEMPPPAASNEFVGPPNLGEFQGPPNLGEAYGPMNWGEVSGPPSQEMAGPPDWMNQSAWEYRQMPQEQAQQIFDIREKGLNPVTKLIDIFNPANMIREGANSAVSQLPAEFGTPEVYPNKWDRLTGDRERSRRQVEAGVYQGRLGKDKYGNSQNQLWRAYFNGNPVPFTR